MRYFFACIIVALLFSSCKHDEKKKDYKVISDLILAHKYKEAGKHISIEFQNDSLKNDMYLYLLGMINHQQKQMIPALRYLNDAMQINPTNTKAIIGKAVIYSELGYCSSALTMADLGCKIDSTDEELRFNRGYVCFQCDSFREAVNDYSYAYLSNPKDKSALSNLAMSYYYADDDDNALIYLNKAVKTDSLNFHIYYALGYLYSDANKVDEAVNVLLKAEKCCEPFNDQKAMMNICYMLSSCYDVMGDSIDSNAYLQKAIANGYVPDDNTN